MKNMAFNSVGSIVVWTVFSLAVQMIVASRWHERIGKGRLFSRPLWRFRFFAPMVSPWGGRPLAGRTRLAQLVVLAPSWTAIVCVFAFGFNIHPPPLFPVAIILLYLDDYVTGDDDSWDRAKNWLKSLRGRFRIRRPAEV